MTELNKLTLERLAGNLLKAQSEQKLMNKQTADYLGLCPADMSFIKRPDTFDNISSRKWAIIHEWNNSGLTLKEFYESKRKEQPEPQPQPEEAPGAKREPVPFPTPEPLKQRIKKAVLRVKEKESEKVKKALLLADEDLKARMNEEKSALLNNSGATIIEPAENPGIRVKPEALEKRKKELATKNLNNSLAKKSARKIDFRRKEASVEDINKVLAKLGVEIDVIVTLKKA